MGFFENMIRIYFARKMAQEVEKEFSDEYSYERPSKCQKVNKIREVFFAPEEITNTMMEELFRREPDLINGEIEEDCREILHVYPTHYSHCGKMHYTAEWFTFSARNRFFIKELLNSSTTYDEYLRDYKYIDFSDRPIRYTANPGERSISLAGYTLYFDLPFFYNLMLMLLKDSEERFENGERVADRAITYPEVMINDDIVREYDIHVDEYARKGLEVYRAFYAVLDDFNVEKTGLGNRKRGRFELRIIDGRINKSDESKPMSIFNLLTIPEERKKFRWIGISPGDFIDGNDGPIYLPGTQFSFLDVAEDVIIRGDENELELYVCRTRNGWGGIKFTVRTKQDYYNLAAWLVVAVSTYCSRHKGWDREKLIRRYWPSYSSRYVGGAEK